jgi:prepilin-type N-terminal cleavage/methylation domain-containing protein
MNGFTLIELIIVIGILAGAVFVIGMFGLDISDFGIILGDTFTAQSEIQQSLSSMILELRSMSLSAAGGYPIVTASPNLLEFFSDINDDGITEKIRYFIQGNIFMRGETGATGSPLTYDPANEEIKELVHNLVIPGAGDVPIFSYYDQNYTGSQAAMISPISVSNVRFISIQLTADASPQNIKSRISLTAGIMIRGLKTN